MTSKARHTTAMVPAMATNVARSASSSPVAAEEEGEEETSTGTVVDMSASVVVVVVVAVVVVSVVVAFVAVGSFSSSLPPRPAACADVGRVATTSKTFERMPKKENDADRSTREDGSI